MQYNNIINMMANNSNAQLGVQECREFYFYRETTQKREKAQEFKVINPVSCCVQIPMDEGQAFTMLTSDKGNYHERTFRLYTVC